MSVISALPNERPDRRTWEAARSQSSRAARLHALAHRALGCHSAIDRARFDARPNREAVWQSAAGRTRIASLLLSARPSADGGSLSESRVKRGDRVVHGGKKLLEVRHVTRKPPQPLTHTDLSEFINQASDFALEMSTPAVLRAWARPVTAARPPRRARRRAGACLVAAPSARLPRTDRARTPSPFRSRGRSTRPFPAGAP